MPDDFSKLSRWDRKRETVLWKFYLRWAFVEPYVGLRAKWERVAFAFVISAPVGWLLGTVLSRFAGLPVTAEMLSWAVPATFATIVIAYRFVIYPANEHIKRVRSEGALLQASHNLGASTPAFANAFQIVRAFTAWRRAIGLSAVGSIKITATPDTTDLAVTVAQLACLGSGCQTFGPDSWDVNPEAEREAVTGMVPEVVVVHIAKDGTGGHALFLALECVIRVKRSYEVQGNIENFVWLQFGPGTRWNSQVRDECSAR